MKKNVIFLMILIALCMMIMVSCNKETPNASVTFFVDDTIYTTSEIQDGALANQPTNPTKEGYVFAGWYFDKDTWEEPLYSGSIAELSEGKEYYVYAYFIQAEHILHYYVDGEIYRAQAISDNTTLRLPLNPKKQYYSFKGWYFDKDTWTNKLTDVSLREALESDEAEYYVYAYFKKTSNSNSESETKQVDSFTAADYFEVLWEETADIANEPLIGKNIYLKLDLGLAINITNGWKYYSNVAVGVLIEMVLDINSADSHDSGFKISLYDAITKETWLTFYFFIKNPYALYVDFDGQHIKIQGDFGDNDSYGTTLHKFFTQTEYVYSGVNFKMIIDTLVEDMGEGWNLNMLFNHIIELLGVDMGSLVDKIPSSIVKVLGVDLNELVDEDGNFQIDKFFQSDIMNMLFTASKVQDGNTISYTATLDSSLLGLVSAFGDLINVKGLDEIIGNNTELTLAFDLVNGKFTGLNCILGLGDVAKRVGLTKRYPEVILSLYDLDFRDASKNTIELDVKEEEYSKDFNWEGLITTTIDGITKVYNDKEYDISGTYTLGLDIDLNLGTDEEETDTNIYLYVERDNEKFLEASFTDDDDALVFRVNRDVKIDDVALVDLFSSKIVRIYNLLGSSFVRQYEYREGRTYYLTNSEEYYLPTTQPTAETFNKFYKVSSKDKFNGTYWYYTYNELSEQYTRVYITKFKEGVTYYYTTPYYATWVPKNILDAFAETFFEDSEHTTIRSDFNGIILYDVDLKTIGNSIFENLIDSLYHEAEKNKEGVEEDAETAGEITNVNCPLIASVIKEMLVTMETSNSQFFVTIDNLMGLCTDIFDPIIDNYSLVGSIQKWDTEKGESRVLEALEAHFVLPNAVDDGSGAANLVALFNSKFTLKVDFTDDKNKDGHLIAATMENVNGYSASVTLTTNLVDKEFISVLPSDFSEETYGCEEKTYKSYNGYYVYHV